MTFLFTGKEGPIHAIAWNPGNWNEWVAVYGHAPAKATLFNAKCEALFEFGTGAWNAIYFPPEGNNILLQFAAILLYYLVGTAPGSTHVDFDSEPLSPVLYYLIYRRSKK